MHLPPKLQILTKFQDLISGTQQFYWESKSKCQTTTSFAKNSRKIHKIHEKFMKFLASSYKKNFLLLWFISFGASSLHFFEFWKILIDILYYYSLKDLVKKTHHFITTYYYFYYYLKLFFFSLFWMPISKGTCD